MASQPWVEGQVSLYLYRIATYQLSRAPVILLLYGWGKVSRRYKYQSIRAATFWYPRFEDFTSILPDSQLVLRYEAVHRLDTLVCLWCKRWVAIFILLPLLILFRLAWKSMPTSEWFLRLIATHLCGCSEWVWAISGYSMPANTAIIVSAWRLMGNMLSQRHIWWHPTREQCSAAKFCIAMHTTVTCLCEFSARKARLIAAACTMCYKKIIECIVVGARRFMVLCIAKLHQLIPKLPKW